MPAPTDINFRELMIKIMNATPITLILALVILGLSIRGYTLKTSNLFLLLAVGMTLSIFIAKAIKLLTARLLPSWITTRPSKGSKLCSNAMGCLDTSDTGYTSAHATAMGFFAMFFTAHATNLFKESIDSDTWLSVVVPWTAAITVASERIYLGCHSPIQVGAGLALGSGLACGFYALTRKWVR